MQQLLSPARADQIMCPSVALSGLLTAHHPNYEEQPQGSGQETSAVRSRSSDIVQNPPGIAQNVAGFKSVVY